MKRNILHKEDRVVGLCQMELGSFYLRSKAIDEKQNTVEGTRHFISAITCKLIQLQDDIKTVAQSLTEVKVVDKITDELISDGHTWLMTKDRFTEFVIELRKIDNERSEITDIYAYLCALCDDIKDGTVAGCTRSLNDLLYRNVSTKIDELNNRLDNLTD